jgi:hypothetical protein
MKYYIPSTTLNFNNILSTESISPFSFYGSRGFGYKSLDKVPPNGLDKRVLLYERYPLFDIDTSEIDSFPLVIEIESDSLKPSIIQKTSCDGVYYSEETIYLNPFATKFFFRNEEERRIAIINSARSLETKLVDIYNHAFMIKTDCNNCFEWNHYAEIADENDTRANYRADAVTNRIKGFLYGYVIGANMSIVDTNYLDAVYYINLLKNELSGLINRVHSKGAYASSQCETAYKNINQILYKLHENKRLAQFDDKNKALVLEFLRNEGFYDAWRKRLLQSKRLFFARPFVGKSVSELNAYISDLRTRVDGMFERMKLNIDAFPTIRESRIETIPNQDALLPFLINGLLSEDSLAEIITSSRYEFALNAAKIFKASMGNQWEGSQEQEYINSLLRNLNEKTQFDLNGANGIMLRSFAAFCKKGEKNNLDLFYDYLISNGIGDVRIAFALWGVVFGFAAMPKTVTNGFFRSSDVKYISDTYKHVYEQLFNLKLPETLILPSIGISQKPPVAANRAWIAFKDEILINWDGGEKYEGLVPDSLKQKPKREFKIQELCDSAESIEAFFELFYNNIKKKSTLNNAMKKVSERVQKNIPWGNQMQFDDIEPNDTVEDIVTTKDAPARNSIKHLYLDDTAFEKICSIIPDSKRDRIKEELDWIQKAHRDGGYKKREDWNPIPKEENTNKKVIDHFKNNCSNGIDKGRLKEIDKRLLEEIVKKLKELYT